MSVERAGDCGRRGDDRRRSSGRPGRVDGLLIQYLGPLLVALFAGYAMLEPVAAALVAYLWLADSLGRAQLVGAAAVLGAILPAQTAR